VRQKLLLVDRVQNRLGIRRRQPINCRSTSPLIPFDSVSPFIGVSISVFPACQYATDVSSLGGSR